MIHCGFVHDFSDYAGMMATERGGLTVFANELAGTDELQRETPLDGLAQVGHNISSTLNA